MLSGCPLLTRRRRTPLVVELPLWLTVGWSPRRTTRKIFASSVERSLHLRGVVGKWQQPVWTSHKAKAVDNRFTPRYTVTGRPTFTSCYKSHRRSIDRSIHPFIHLSVYYFTPLEFWTIYKPRFINSYLYLYLFLVVPRIMGQFTWIICHTLL